MLLDYYLFRSLQNFLNGNTFDNGEAIKSRFVFCLLYNGQKRIMNLPERWRKVIHQNGKYIIDYIAYKLKKMFLLSFKKLLVSFGTSQ